MALTDLDSITQRLALQDAGGCLERMFHTTISATNAATTGCGYISAQRYPLTFSVPSLTGYTGWEIDAEMFSEDAGILMAALEYDLGSLAVSTNTFSAGSDSSMPTKDTRIDGTTYSSRQTASMIPMLVVTSGVTATTPTITITYQNEDGTGSRTCSMTLPSTPIVNTAFLMTPHLNSEDTGIEDVTNMSKSAGTAGTLAVKGIIPLAVSSIATSGMTTTGWTRSLLRPEAPVLALSGETIAFYAFGRSTASDLQACIYGRPI